MKHLLLLSTLLIISSLCIAAYACHFKNSPPTNNNEERNITENIEPKNENSVDFELLPTLNSVSSAKNQVWVGTFQLVWNDLIDELIKHPVQFVNYQSDMADNLNKKSFDVNDISDSAYYKKYGLASPALKKEMELGIKEKFNETSDILDYLDWTPEEGKYVLYAMMKKDFEFIEKLNYLGKSKFKGSDEEVEYFGLSTDSTNKQKDSVEVLFYNNPFDYAVALKSKQGDVIKLYRTNSDKTLNDYYDDMNKKTIEYKGSLNDKDQLKVPMMNFKSIREFRELCNKPIKNSDLLIAMAIETIQFKMDEAGAKLKSEAVITTFKGCAPGIIETQPRYFYFDDQFVMFIAEDGKKPYFAMKVTDAKQLQQKN